LIDVLGQVGKMKGARWVVQTLGVIDLLQLTKDLSLRVQIINVLPWEKVEDIEQFQCQM
jgi:hypothetical protein